jgi:hypothetical protein
MEAADGNLSPPTVIGQPWRLPVDLLDRDISQSHAGAMHTLSDDELAAGLSCAGETLERDIWDALDGHAEALERVRTALDEIRRLSVMFEQRVGASNTRV